MSVANRVLIASGIATLEAMLLKSKQRWLYSLLPGYCLCTRRSSRYDSQPASAMKFRLGPPLTIATLTIAIGFSPPVPAEEGDNSVENGFPIPAHTASYELVRGGSRLGWVQVSLRQASNEQWLYKVETVATAMTARLLGLGARESSLFRWRGGIVPLQYRQTLSRLGSKRYWEHDFHWNKGISDTRTHQGNHRIPLESGTLDPLALRLAAAGILATRGAGKQTLEFSVLERDEIENQEFRYLGQEFLTLGIGCFDTLRMERFRREGSSRNYRSWHSERFYWMPVRIFQYEDDLDIRLIETSIFLGPDDCQHH